MILGGAKSYQCLPETSAFVWLHLKILRPLTVQAEMARNLNLKIMPLMMWSLRSKSASNNIYRTSLKKKKNKVPTSYSSWWEEKIKAETWKPPTGGLNGNVNPGKPQVFPPDHRTVVRWSMVFTSPLGGYNVLADLCTKHGYFHQRHWSGMGQILNL